MLFILSFRIYHFLIKVYECKYMNVDGKHYRSIWLKEDNEEVVQVIDQRFLPHRFIIEDLRTVDEVARAIKEMHIRGAGVIGATAGYGMYISAIHAPQGSENAFMAVLQDDGSKLKDTRPTAVNLEWEAIGLIHDPEIANDIELVGYATAISEEVAALDTQAAQHFVEFILLSTMIKTEATL